MAVYRSGESHTRDRGHGGGLGGAATRFVAAFARGGIPDLFAVGQAENVHAAADIRVGVGDLRVAQLDAPDVGIGYIDVCAVGRRAPLDSAHGSSFAHARLPEDFALLI